MVDKRIKDLPHDTTPDDVDNIVTDGALGTRRSTIGELRTAMLGGVDVTYPHIRVMDTGGSRPVPAPKGPTAGWTFQVGDFLYFEVPLHQKLDRTQQIVIGVGWSPNGSQAAKTVTWRIDLAGEKLGIDVTAIGDTTDAVDEAVPATTGLYARTGLLVAAAVYADPAIDELHVRLTRLATAADPAADPDVHHIVVVQPLLG